MTKAANKSLKKTIIISICVAIFMLGFSFALVPLYTTFCNITGLNGKVDLSKPGTYQASKNGVDYSRIVTVEFDVNFNQEMPWIFKPEKHEVKLRPGEVVTTYYFAKNPTNKIITAQAIPSISPGLGAKHLKKVQCFCFDRQVLKPGEEAKMALSFYIDKKIPKDIPRLTLSYTLFDVNARKVKS